MRPLPFSVVIPLYNKALHIERALNSVLGQTCQDFEIIVVDDGSTDNGAEIVQGVRDSRIRLISQRNSGVSAARNRGAEAANHELVAFLDADDEWLPEFLHNILVLVNNFPDCGAYATASQTIRPTGRQFLTSLDQLPPEPWIGIIPNLFELLQTGYPFNSSSICIPKRVLLDVGGFPVNVRYSEDVVCWIRIAIRYPIAFNPKRLVTYHQNAANRSLAYKVLDEPAYIHTVREAISNGSMPAELEPAAVEYIAQRRILTAIENIMAGNPGYARHLLARCRGTRKYKRLWLWWRFWAFFPAGWPNRFMQLKQRLGRIAA